MTGPGTVLICLPFAGAGASCFRSWAAATSQDFTLAEVAGRHMYLTDGPGPMLRLAGAVGV